MTTFHGTTIVLVRAKGQVVIGGDGQVTLGPTIFKHKTRKVRRLGDGKIIGGFAGSAADGITLFEKFESKLKEHGNLTRAAVELAKEWRMDRILRRLEAMVIVADRERTFVLSGSGDVIEPDDGICAIGSGGSYALAAARALVAHTQMSAGEIARAALQIAADVCIYTNANFLFEEIQ